MRKMLNVLQMSVKDDAVVLDETVLTSTSYIKEVLKELAGNKKWLTIRQIIADSIQRTLRNYIVHYSNTVQNMPQVKKALLQLY
jgi:CRISPR/Cas system-associated protein Cas5 (RAMP superfamily)